MKSPDGHALGAALALAALATAGLLLTGCGQDTNDADEGSGATSSPTPTPSGQPTPVLGGPLQTEGLPTGQTPAISWIEGRTLHTADGDVPLPGDYSQVVEYDRGWLALGHDDRGSIAVRLDRTGAVKETVRTSDAVATAPDGSQVLWVSDGVLTLHDNGSGKDTVIGRGHAGTEPVAVVDGTAYYNEAGAEGPRDGRWWRDGAEHDPIPGPAQPYRDVSVDGVTATLSSITDFESCSTVRSPQGDTVGETCDFTLDTFSPDGAHLLAGPTYRDGFGDGELAVLPVTEGSVSRDAVLVHYRREGDSDPFFLDTAWEDATHVLAVTYTPTDGFAEGSWQIVRIGLDGTVENAVEPVAGDDAHFPFTLA